MWVENFNSKDICAENLKGAYITAEEEIVNKLCVSDKLYAKSVAALSLNANALCSQEGTINKLCVNDLTVGSLKFCQKYIASAGLNGDISYTLGSNVNWDKVINDPNNNIALAPFSYAVPVSGYYDFSYYLSTDDLQGATVIAGTPIGVMTVQVNGIDMRKNTAPFLSFLGLQYSVLSSLVLLKAGDVVKMKYEILVLDPVTGLMPYVGTVMIRSLLSGFDIHYLSSSECSPVICATCPPVQVPCEMVTVDCSRPNGDGTQDPCGPCQ